VAGPPGQATSAVTVILLVRLRAGVVGERERVCHVVPAPDRDAVPGALVAYCGLRIAPGTADLLAAPAGMPCVGCLVRMPLPFGVELPPVPD
jgi:hypothetical protein